MMELLKKMDSSFKALHIGADAAYLRNTTSNRCMEPASSCSFADPLWWTPPDVGVARPSEPWPTAAKATRLPVEPLVNSLGAVSSACAA